MLKPHSHLPLPRSDVIAFELWLGRARIPGQVSLFIMVVVNYTHGDIASVFCSLSYAFYFVGHKISADYFKDGSVVML